MKNSYSDYVTIFELLRKKGKVDSTSSYTDLLYEKGNYYEEQYNDLLNKYNELSKKYNSTYLKSEMQGESMI